MNIGKKNRYTMMLKISRDKYSMCFLIFSIKLKYLFTHVYIIYNIYAAIHIMVLYLY